MGTKWTGTSLAKLLSGQTFATPRSAAGLFFAAWLLAAASALAAWQAWGGELIAAAFRGELGWPLDQVVEWHRSGDPSRRTLAYYRFQGRLVPGWILFGLALAFASAALAARRRVAAAALRGFFAARGRAEELGVFRVVFFATLAVFVVGQPPLLAGVPAELQVPPVGVGWLWEHLPTSGPPVVAARRLLVLTAALACAGLWARASALASALLYLYVGAVLNGYGMVSHNQHFAWFALLLAAAPCGDALSCDAALGAWRNPGHAARPRPSRAYALPLRVVWLLFGVMYFFPGMWKLLLAGYDWVAGDRFQVLLYNVWFMHRQWTGRVPVGASLGIEAHPLLYRAAGATVIAFELCFAFMLFTPRLRARAAAAGLLFHNLTGLFTGIFFWKLQPLYAAFVPWRRAAVVLRRRLGVRRARFVFAAGVERQRRLAAVLASADPLGLVRCAPRGGAAGPPEVWIGGEHRRGARAAAALAVRLPGALLLAPLLPLLIVAAARGRAGRGAARTRGARPAVRRAAWPAAAVGGVLLAGNSAFGLAVIVDGWPFACYPTFVGSKQPYVDVLEVSYRGADPGERSYDAAALRREFRQKWEGFELQILRAPASAGRDSAARALLGFVAARDRALSGAHELYLRRERVLTSTRAGIGTRVSSERLATLVLRPAPPP